VTGATLDTLAAFPWTFGPGGEAYAASWDPSTDTTRFLLIDPETGQETLLATLTAPAGGSAGLGGFAVEPGGDFIAAAPVYYSEMDFLGAVVRIDRQTGAVDVLCALPEGTNCPSPSDVVIGPDGDAYVTDFNGSGIRRIDLVSGGISGVAADTDSPSSIAVVPAPAPPPLALVALAFAALGVRGLRSGRAARHP
jgi:hypothetical protein